jgi:hypothetical protein
MVAERGRQAFIFTLPVPPRDLLRPFFYLLCARQKTLSLLALFAPLSPAVVVCDDGDLEVCLVCYKCMLCMYVSNANARAVCLRLLAHSNSKSPLTPSRRKSRADRTAIVLYFLWAALGACSRLEFVSKAPTVLLPPLLIRLF